jgi:hypothetical protein
MRKKSVKNEQQATPSVIEQIHGKIDGLNARISESLWNYAGAFTDQTTLDEIRNIVTRQLEDGYYYPRVQFPAISTSPGVTYKINWDIVF